MNSMQSMGPEPCRPTAAIFLPPPAIGETAWDILLALHADRCPEFGLVKLARLVSVPQPALHRWLELLEERKLIAGVWTQCPGGPRPSLTTAGRALLDRYFSAAGELHIVAHS